MFGCLHINNKQGYTKKVSKLRKYSLSADASSYQMYCLIRLAEKGHGYVVVPVIKLPVDQIESRLRDIEVELLRGEAVNSSAIRISWMVNVSIVHRSQETQS